MNLDGLFIYCAPWKLVRAINVQANRFYLDAQLYIVFNNLNESLRKFVPAF